MRFDIESGSVSMYLGNRVIVNSVHQKIVHDQEELVDNLLNQFGMKDCTPVPTMVASLLGVNSGEKLDTKEHELYRTIVGSLFYLGCSSWSAENCIMIVKNCINHPNPKL
jgi:hypothetical protein